MERGMIIASWHTIKSTLSLKVAYCKDKDKDTFIGLQEFVVILHYYVNFNIINNDYFFVSMKTDTVSYRALCIIRVCVAHGHVVTCSMDCWQLPKTISETQLQSHTLIHTKPHNYKCQNKKKNGIKSRLVQHMPELAGSGGRDAHTNHLTQEA